MKIIYFSLIVVIFLSFQHLHAQTTDISSVESTNTAELDKYPILSERLLNTEITLIEKDEKIKLADYRNDIIVLSFVAEWATPARTTIADLNKLYSENLRNLMIIAVCAEVTKSDTWNFKKFVESSNIKFQTGCINQKFVEEFIKISKFYGVPQSFVIKDQKLRGVFTGYSPKINESLVNLVRKISAEENLNQ
ncbi:MAG: redoxin domain-containing protein [Acidobacteriota bacterium]